MWDRVAVNEERYGFEVARLAGMQYNPAANVNFARLIDEQFQGGVVFSNYTGESISIHVGAVNSQWINRDMLWITFDYPFKQLGVKSIFGLVAEDNLHALNFDRKLGFKQVARIEGVYPNDIACIVMRMKRDECRFLDLQPRAFAMGSVTLQ